MNSKKRKRSTKIKSNIDELESNINQLESNNKKRKSTEIEIESTEIEIESTEIKSNIDQLESTNIDKLPPELIPLIFKNLNFNDLLNCRLINKKYKDFADEAIICIDELIVFDLNYDSSDLISTWFDNNKPINYDDDAITFDKFKLYKSSIDKFNELSKKLQFNLSRLTIGYKSKEFGSEINLSPFINNFKNLKHLQILDSDVYFDVIDLVNLITLDIESYYSDFELITPKLRSLKACNLEEIFIAHPGSINYLELIYCTEDEIELFNNLECLSINSLDHLNTYNLLSKFEKLRKLFINIDWYDNIESFEIIKIKFNKIHQQKLNLRRDNLEIYLQGILIQNSDEYEWPILLDDEFIFDDLEFQMRNYDKFGDYIYHYDDYSLDYCKLLELVDRIPFDIHKKYFFIKSVEINNEIEDEDQLLWFLLNLPCLYKLNFNYNQTFSQSFYNNLIKLSKLNHLELNTEDDKLINYDFLLKIKYLNHFKIQNSSNQLADVSVKAFEQLKRLEFFGFKKDDLKIWVIQSDEFSNFYFLTILNDNYDILFAQEKICFCCLISLLIKIKDDQFTRLRNKIKLSI